MQKAVFLYACMFCAIVTKMISFLCESCDTLKPPEQENRLYFQRGGLACECYELALAGGRRAVRRGEAATAGLVSIWFAAGAVAGLIAAWLGAGVAAQVVLFAVVSAAALAVTRPLVRRYAAGKAVPTNLDRVLGDTGRVTETIDNARSAGAVYVDGKTWTARSDDGAVIPQGTTVKILRMEGVTLFVKKIEEKVEVTS